MTDFKRLIVWQKAHALALLAYRTSGEIRARQLQGLRSQIVRAALSIPTNIVEGRSQRSEKEFARFIGIALNSCSELEYHIIVAREIEALSDGKCDVLLHNATEVRRILIGLRRRLDESVARAEMAQ